MKLTKLSKIISSLVESKFLSFLKEGGSPQPKALQIFSLLLFFYFEGKEKDKLGKERRTFC